MSNQTSSKTSLKKWVRRLVLGFGVIFGVILAVNLYLGFFPASIKSPAKRYTIEKVSDAENAWLDYKLATEVFKDSDKSVWEKYDGLSELTPEQEADLDKHIKAIDYLKVGVNKPKFQFYKELATHDTKLLSITDFIHLSKLAIAQASRLEKEGKSNEALDLELAVYHMGTQVFEPYTPMTSALLSWSCHRVVAKALFKRLNKGGGDKDLYLKIANKIAEDDSKSSTPQEIMEWEWQFGNRSLEDSLVNGPTQKQFPKNLSVRVYNDFVLKHNELVEKLIKPSLETLDVKAMQEVDKKISEFIEQENKWYKNLFVDKYIASVLFSVAIPSAKGVVNSFYADRANAAALQTLAIIRAYEQENGKFPENLEAALQDASLKIPLDIATKKIAGYRLENNKPIVWLAGFDGKDDGGKTAYKNARVATDGSDFIYSLGEIPEHLIEGKASAK